MKDRNTRIKEMLIAAATVMIFSGVLSASAFAAGDSVLVKGSTTILPIAQVAAEAFMDDNPGITVSVQGGGSGMGIASLLDGTAHIADASRQIKAAEIDKAMSVGITPVEHVIAMDGIAVVVHPSNPVGKLTRDQVRMVYTGRVSNWEALGGANSKIVIVSRDTSSGTFETFAELALNREKVRPGALTAASNQAVAQIVSQTPGAIGYLGFGYVNAKVKALVIDDIVCTRENILSGEYALSRPLYMYAGGMPSGSVKSFIDFVLSPRGQRLVEEEGFIGVNQ